MKENINYKAVFNQIISEAKADSISDLDQLIERYPYAQALRIVSMSHHQNNEKIGTALLFAGSTQHLYNFIHVDGQTVFSGQEKQQVDDVFLEEQQDEASGNTVVVNDLLVEKVVSEVRDIESKELGTTGIENDVEQDPVKKDLTPLEDVVSMSSSGENNESLETFIEHPVSGDFFVYERVQESLKEQSQGLSDDFVLSTDSSKSDFDNLQEDGGHVRGEKGEGVVPLTQANPHEKVSLYDDEHMPYTFLWWLNKARMEHAETYQPYTKRTTNNAQTIYEDGSKVLDQQIRENIFYLQPPEQKLSHSLNVQNPNIQQREKIDPVIEKFIREEPQITPPNPDKLTLENKAKKSAETPIAVATETLARIYVEQGHYIKAIEVYKKLSLNNPEKSSYFAGQISEIEKKLN